MFDPTQFSNNQELFDAAWKWLITDGYPKCVNSAGLCSYRAKRGEDELETCVIGAFIPLTLLPSNFYGGIADLMIEMPAVGAWFKNVSLEVMQWIQAVHDNGEINKDNTAQRREAMKTIAARFNLNIPNE